MLATDGLLISALTDPTMQWVLIAAGAVVMAYVVFRPFMKRKDPLGDDFSKPFLSQQRSTERVMTNLLVELEQMARQITAQLDTRAMKLQVLMEQADQRIAELQRLQMRGTQAEQVSMSMALTPDAPQVEVAEVDSRHARIYELHDSGRSARQIADAVEQPVGEIELILALRAPREE